MSSSDGTEANPESRSVQGPGPKAVDGPAVDMPLGHRVLLWVASRLGPALDQIDVDPRDNGARVRDALLDFCKPGGPTPAEVRAAFLDLEKQGWLSIGQLVTSPDATVRLSIPGLMHARAIDPEAGRVKRIVTLHMRPWKTNGLFGAWIDTGRKDPDKKINDSGLSLAAFYVLAAEEPSRANPLLLSRCSWMFARLSALSVGPKFGPGVRVMPSEEAMSSAFDLVAWAVPIKGEKVDDDKRRKQWFLREPFPEVRLVGPRGPQFADWAWMRENLRFAIRGRQFLNRRHEAVAPLTDEQCAKLEKETLRKHRRNVSSSKPAAEG